MKEFDQLLSKLQLYSCKEKYTGCCPSIDHQLHNCEVTGESDFALFLGDCQETSID